MAGSRLGAIKGWQSRRSGRGANKGRVPLTLNVTGVGPLTRFEHRKG